MATSEATADGLFVGEWQVLANDGVIRGRSRLIRLTVQQMTLLLYLVEHRDRVVGKEEIFRSVWRDAEVEEIALPRCISEIRRALGDDARKPRYIETFPKRGYRLVATVREEISAPRESPAPAADRRTIQQASPLGSSHSRPSGSAGRTAVRGWPFLRLGAAWGLPICLVLLVALSVRYSFTDEERPAVDPRPPATTSVAVLALQDLASGSETAWMSSALAEMLTSELALSEDLSVMPRSAVSGLQRELGLEIVAATAPPQLLRGALGVEHLVSGSYLVSGSDSPRLRLDLRVWDREQPAGYHALIEIGSEQELLELVAVSGQRLRQLLRAAEPTTSIQQTAVDLGANKLYAQSLDLLRRQEAQAARQLLDAAIVIEPNRPLAHLALARAWAELGYESQADQAATRAAELSGDLPREQRLWVESEVYRRQRRWPEAIERLRALRVFAPENPEYGLQLIRTLNQAGLAEQALAAVADQLPSDGPRDPRLVLAISDAHYLLGDFEKSRSAAQQATDLATSAGAELVVAEGLHRQALAMHKLGRAEQAVATLEEAEDIYRQNGDRRQRACILGARAGWLAAKGEFSTARALAEAGLEVFRQIGDRANEGKLLRTLGRIAGSVHDETTARTSLDRALVLSRELSNPDEEASVLSALGIFEASSGRHGDALPFFEQALEKYRQLGNLEKVGNQLVNLGRLSMFRSDFPAALKRFEEADEIFRQTATKESCARLQLNLGLVQSIVGDLPGAEDALKSAERHFSTVGNGLLSALALAGLAEVSIDRGELEAARRYVDQAEALYVQLGDSRRLASVQVSKAWVLLESGQIELAAAASEEVASTEEVNGQTQVNALRLLAETELARGHLDAAREAARRARRRISQSDVARTALCHLWLPITEARIEKASGRHRTAHTLAMEVRDLAASWGAWLAHAEARVLLLDVDMSASLDGAASDQASVLAADADRRGWRRIALAARRAGATEAM